MPLVFTAAGLIERSALKFAFTPEEVGSALTIATEWRYYGPNGGTDEMKARAQLLLARANDLRFAAGEDSGAIAAAESDLVKARALIDALSALKQGDLVRRSVWADVLLPQSISGDQAQI